MVFHYTRVQGGPTGTKENPRKGPELPVISGVFVRVHVLSLFLH